MSSFRKCLSVALVVLMVMGCCASMFTAGAAKVTENGVTYSVDKNTMTAGVFSYKSISSADEVVIPAEIDGCKVVSVLQSAFRFNTDIVSVTFPETMEKIEGYAFDGCTNLEVASVNSDLVSIGTASFRNCGKLTEVYLGNALTSIGAAAFKSSGITEAIIPDTCETVGTSAFYECVNLVKAVLPEKLTLIEGNLFSRCYLLEEIVIPDGVTSIEEDAFNRCTSLTSVKMGNNVVSIGQRAFYNCVNLNSLNLSVSLTAIADNVFWDCDSLEEINIPVGIKSLEFQVFRSCDKLHTVYFSEGVETIGERVFMNCESISNIVIPATVKEIAERAFIGCDDITIYGERDSAAHEYAKTYKFDFIGYEVSDDEAILTAYESAKTDITVPATLAGVPVTTISTDAFKGNEAIKSITLASGVNVVSDFAFAGCTSLENVQFAADNTYIGKYVFADCTAIKNVCLPEGVVTIDECAFGYVSDGEGGYVASESFHIYGAINSTAQEYCEANGIQFRFGLLKEVASGDIVMGMNYVEKSYETGDKYHMINILGDVNDDGFVNIKDATQIQKASAGIEDLDKATEYLADVNFDGRYNVKDATQIQKYVASIIVSFYK